MEKISRNFSIKVSLVLVLFISGVFGTAMPAIAQPHLEILFGPKEFLRGKGKPIIEYLQFSITGFEQPFILHLRNGDVDAEHRVSSAWVWLNGLPIFAPSDFNQQVSGYDVEVALTDPSVLEVKLASKPEAKLTIWIEGKPINPNIRSVGPGGGIFKFPNGVMLDIPPGAVTQTILITLTDLPVDAVNAILEARNYASHTKRCLGGFSAEPTGLVFLVPIKAIVPVLPLTSGWIPAQIEVDLNKQTYAIVPGDVVYHGDENVMEMTIRHLSGHAGVEITDSDPIEQSCRHCATFNWSTCAAFESCPPASDDPCCVPQDACCTILKEERGNCSKLTSPCNCCREEEVKVTVGEADFSAGQCGIVSSTVSVEYPICNPGCVTHDVVAEETPGCSQIKNFTLTIRRDRDSIFSCQVLELWAEVSGTSEDGTVQFYGAAIPVTWEITEGKDVVEFVNKVGVNGVVVKGLREGFATIRATADGKPDLYREIIVQVYDLRLFVFPEQTVLNVGGQEANCKLP